MQFQTEAHKRTAGHESLSGPKDQRAAERYPANADSSCSFLAPVVEDYGPSRIKNISMDGIGLLVTRRVEPGALLAITLSNPTRGFSRTMLVRVVHATPQLAGWLVGGTFNTPLSYQELTALVL